MTKLKEDAARWSAQVTPSAVTAERAEAPAADTGDPGDGHALCAALLSRLRQKVETELDPDVQFEIGRLINLLAVTPKTTVQEQAALFGLAVDVITADKPNLLLAQSIWRDLMFINDRSSRGLIRLVSLIAGKTAVSASISALLVAGLTSLLLLFLMVSGHYLLLGKDFRASELLSQLQTGDASLVILGVHAAFIGGIISMMARIQDFVDSDKAGPVLVFISVFRKPFLGAAFSVLVFCVLKAGLVTIPGLSLQGAQGIYTAWALGFLCGFSERFASDIVHSASSRLGTQSMPPASAYPRAADGAASPTSPSK